MPISCQRNLSPFSYTVCDIAEFDAWLERVCRRHGREVVERNALERLTRFNEVRHHWLGLEGLRSSRCLSLSAARSTFITRPDSYPATIDFKALFSAPTCATVAIT